MLLEGLTTNRLLEWVVKGNHKTEATDMGKEEYQLETCFSNRLSLDYKYILDINLKIKASGKVDSFNEGLPPFR